MSSRGRRSDRFRRSITEPVADAAADAAVDAASGAARRIFSRQPRETGGLREKRIEWVTWGISVIVLGITVLVGVGTPIGQNDALWFIFPAAAGGLMMLSAVLQKIIRNWNVSIFTWTISALLMALAVERFVALFITLNRSFRPIYYLGGLILIVGFVILLQIFRRA
jgi:hypothetical protein